MWVKKLRAIPVDIRFVGLMAALFIVVEAFGARPAGAQVSDTFNEWTATAMIEQLENGDIEGSASFEDNDTGGARRGGVCLVTDLGLGRCETKEACSAKAVARGLPGTGTEGWYHYCAAAATDEGTPGKHKRCWARPGRQPDYCALGNNLPATVQTKTVSPYGIAHLDDDERDWTALVCIAGGTAPDGSTVGDPSGCALLTLYKYILDTPLEVPGLDDSEE